MCCSNNDYSEWWTFLLQMSLKLVMNTYPCQNICEIFHQNLRWVKSALSLLINSHMCHIWQTRDTIHQKTNILEWTIPNCHHLYKEETTFKWGIKLQSNACDSNGLNKDLWISQLICYTTINVIININVIELFIIIFK